MLGPLLYLLIAPGSAQAPRNAPASASVSSASIDPQGVQKARALVELINPFDLMLQTNMKGWEAGLASTLRLSPGMDKLEAAYPGVQKAAADAARPLGRDYCAQLVRRIAEHKAGLVAQRLSVAELDQALRLFRQPFWTRFVRALASNADPSSMARDVAKKVAETGQLEIIKEAMDKATFDAARRTANDVTADDQVAMMRLGQASFSSKLTAVAAESDRTLIEWVNKPDPAFLAKQQEAIHAAIIAFVDAPK